MLTTGETIMLVVGVALAVLVLFYCISGTIVRYRRGVRTCPDMMPHMAFWADTCCWLCCCGKKRMNMADRHRLTELPSEYVGGAGEAANGTEFELTDSNNNMNNANSNAHGAGFGNLFKRGAASFQRRSKRDGAVVIVGGLDPNTGRSRNDDDYYHGSSGIGSGGDSTGDGENNKFTSLQHSTSGVGLKSTQINDDDEDDNAKRSNSRRNANNSSGLTWNELDRIDEENEELDVVGGRANNINNSHKKTDSSISVVVGMGTPQHVALQNLPSATNNITSNPTESNNEQPHHSRGRSAQIIVQDEEDGFA